MKVGCENRSVPKRTRTATSTDFPKTLILIWPTPVLVSGKAREASAMPRIVTENRRVVDSLCDWQEILYT